MASPQRQIHAVPPKGDESESDMQKSQQENWATRWFVPKSGVRKMAAQEAKGVFVQWPLLIIIITLASILIGAIVGLQVQVSNLNTTLLLRDQDHSRQVSDLKADMLSLREKNDLLSMYIYDDREKLAVIKSRLGIK